MGTRRLRTAIAVLTCTVASLAAALPGSPVAAATTTAPPSALGVFRGSGQFAEVDAYEQWLGAPVAWALDFLPKDSWAGIDDPTWWINRWRDKGRQVVYSVAMVPHGTSATLEAGARGDYDEHWRRMATTFVQRGAPDATFRLGWEMNGRFFAWRAGGREEVFAAYWRRIVTTMRSVPGSRFRFDWAPLMGGTGADLARAYPGDAYVDVIGLSAYDQRVARPELSSARLWEVMRDGKHGLQWHRDFARAHGKPVSFPEWGLSAHPTTRRADEDHAFYIEQMHAWMRSSDLAYAMYFESDPKDWHHRLMTGRFPKAASTFRRLFGAGLPAGASAPTSQPQATARSIERSCPSGRVPAAGFGDVPAGSTHARPIDCVAWWGIAQGTAPARYLPEGAVTRAQMASFVARLVEASGGTLPVSPPDAFRDDDGSLHARAIDQLAAVGVVGGRDDGTFDPGGAVTRAQLATFLVRSHQHRTGQLLGATRDWFADDRGSPHETNIDRAASAGLTTGRADGTYGPGGSVTRGQMASFFARHLDLLAEQGRVASR